MSFNIDSARRHRISRRQWVKVRQGRKLLVDALTFTSDQRSNSQSAGPDHPRKVGEPVNTFKRTRPGRSYDAAYTWSREDAP